MPLPLRARKHVQARVLCAAVHPNDCRCEAVTLEIANSFD
jgi:hypothetical protein